MKMKTNPAMGGGANASKKLLAAVAVLAVAFVVFAAIPAVDADDSTTTVSDFSAFKNAVENSAVTTITLGADISITEDLTIVGKTIDTVGHQLWVVDGKTLSGQNGSKIVRATGNYAAIVLKNGTVSDMIFDISAGYGVSYNNSPDGNATIDGCTFNTSNVYCAIYVDANCADKTVTIANSTFNGTCTGDAAVVVDVYGVGTVTKLENNVFNNNGSDLGVFSQRGATLGTDIVPQNGMNVKVMNQGSDTYSNEVTVSKNTTVKDLEIANGAKVTVDPNVDLSVSGTATGTIDNNGTVTALNGANLYGANISGNGTVTSRTDDSDKENVNIDGTIKGTANEYDADQIVTINGDTKIVAGAVLKINGTLVVKEGVTLTLEAGSRLVIANNAIMDIQGTVVVEEAYGVPGESGYVAPAEFEIRGIVTVYGALDVNGTVTFATGTVTIEQDGVVDILPEGRIAGAPSAYKFVVKASGILNVEGSVAAMTIENNGSIIFDSKVASGNIIVDMKNGAVLDVKNITLAKVGTITVTDDATEASSDWNQVELKVTDAGEKGSATATTITENASVYATISGISISEVVTSKTVRNTTTYTYVMTMSGSASVSPIYLGTGEEPAYMGATSSVELSGFTPTSTDDKSKLTIAEGLTIGENVTLNNRGTLEVTVLVDATKGTVSNESSGKITVSDSGSIVVKQETISGDANINASKYVVGTTDKTYYYVTLDNALAAAAIGTTKDIKALGTQTLAESAELVTGATLDIDGATLVIGSGDNASDDVLTIRSGATVKGTPAVPTTTGGKAIDVKGTVYAENKRDLKTDVTTALNAGAAVYSEEIDERNRPVSNGWAKWTNVYTAMADSTLTVVKLKNAIVLDKNLTIPEGKILDTDGNNVTAEKNVVVTVEGTLDIGAGSVITLKKVGNESASIVVKGLIASDNDLDSTDGVIRTSTSTTSGGTTTTTEAKYLPLGAYFMIDGTFYMTTVENAATIISTVDEQKIQIKGQPADKLTVAGDIAFVGTDDMATIDVQISEIVFSGSVSIDNAVIVFPAGAKVSGTFTNGSGSVSLKGMVPASATGATTVNTLSVSSETNDGTAVLTVSGKLAKIPAATTTSSAIEQTFTVTGAVTVSGIALDNAIVDGTLTVKGSTNTITTLTVNGSVIISASGKLGSATATVLGTLTASEKTSASGSTDAEFEVGTLYIGTTKAAVSGSTGANAAVVGKVVLKDSTASAADAYAVAAAGSTVPAGFTPEDRSIVSTAYYVDNGLFVTVYAKSSTSVTIYNTVKASKDNAEFKAWSTVDGDAGKDVGSSAEIGSEESVYAVFNYNIYKVFVYADSAVDNLYIDGNLMVKEYDDSGAIAFSSGDARLVAGTHTFSYTLKNGYSGEGTFKILSDGKSTVSGKTLTLSGNPGVTGKIDVKIQLTGFTASGYTPVTPVTPSEDKDDGLTITDYLLIILVVLIVIMAVIVAMRLMRS